MLVPQKNLVRTLTDKIIPTKI